MTLSIEIKYFKQDVVWENVDCCRVSVALAYDTQSQHLLQSPWESRTMHLERIRFFLPCGDIEQSL